MDRPSEASVSGSASPARWPRLALYVLLLLTLVHGAVYAAVVPPWQAPDEPKHFEYVALLYNTGGLVTREQASPALQARIIASMRDFDFWRFGEGKVPPADKPTFKAMWPSTPTQLHRPPLYYLLAVPVYALVADQDIVLQLEVLRLFSAALGVLTVLVAYLLTREVFPNRPLLAVVVPAFVALLPMFAFVSGSFNSDNLANLVAAVLIYLLVRALRAGLSAGYVLSSVGLLLAGFWTKRTTLFAVPLVVISGAIYLAAGRLRLGWKAGVAGVLVLLAGGWALTFPAVREGLRWAIDRYLFDNSAAIDLSYLQKQDYGLEALSRIYGRFSWALLESFWGRFGWMNVRLSATIYQAILVVSVLAAIGLVVLLLRARRRPGYLSRRQQAALLVCSLAAALLTGLILAQYTALNVIYQAALPQGRYLFPALLPIALLFVLGCRELAPRRAQAPVLAVVLATLFLLGALSLVVYIVPTYYRL